MKVPDVSIFDFDLALMRTEKDFHCENVNSTACTALALLGICDRLIMPTFLRIGGTTLTRYVSNVCK